MKAERETLKAFDKRLSKERDRNDQDGEKKDSEEDSCKTISTAE
jgi:hypothetical protein